MKTKAEKGPDLEFRTAAYFQAHGYLVRRDVKLSVAAGTADVTDIDLLALRFGLPLYEERVVVDCKQRRKPRPFERVLWTLGLASFSRTQRAVVVVPQAPWQAREFAAQGGVEILGEDQLDAFLEPMDPSVRAFGDADPALARRLAQHVKADRDGTKQLSRELLRLRQMLVIGHPLTNLNRVIRGVSTSGKLASQHSSSAWLARYVCYDAAVAAAVMLVRFAVEAKWTPEANWRDYALKKLTYGDVPPDKAQQLASLAFSREYSNGLPKPGYADEILELIGSLVAQPPLAAVVPFALDLQLFGQTLGGLPREQGATLLGELHEPAQRLARRVLSALAYAARVSADIWGAGPGPGSGGAAPETGGNRPMLPGMS